MHHLTRILFAAAVGLALSACGASSAPAGADADAGAVEAPDAGPACTGGRTLCVSACIDTTSDPNHCGSCGRVCADGEPCVNGACEAVDCRKSGCAGQQWCDSATGRCRAGCGSDAQC
ncbi:MAG: hypothetical protein ACK4N5_27575, partial [Myxococcales bacterium]